jgi:hypothetical protein
MEWIGDINDLIKFGAELEPNTWCIKFNGVRVQLTKKELYKTTKIAERHLRDHIFVNFWQGHYWHKNLGNTFELNGGWTRNNGYVEKSKAEFKIMAKELTKHLLDKKIFTIEEI